MSKTDRFMMASGVVLGCLDSEEVCKELNEKGIDVPKLKDALGDVYLATLTGSNEKGNSLDWEGEG